MKLGGRGIYDFTATARCAAHKVRTCARRRDLAPILKVLQEAGITSLNAIASALNPRRVATPAGSGHWHPMQVARLLKRRAV
jgi:hypothetical protein